MAKPKKKNSTGEKYAPRKDLGASIDAYSKKLKGPVREALEALVELVHSAVPEATAQLKWGMPVFSDHGLLCYLRAEASYVRFGFYDHAEAMPDPQGLLEGSSKGKHVKVATVGDIDRARFSSWLRTAARLNARQ